MLETQRGGVERRSCGRNGGYDIPALCVSGAVLPLFSSYNGDGSETANFGGSAFTYAIPGGFTAWNG